MAQEKQKPVEQNNAAESPEKKAEAVRAHIEKTAEFRAGFTRRFFEKVLQKPIAEFATDAAKAPYNLTIDVNDDKSLALGVYEFQQKLGMAPDIKGKYGADGMYGAVTNARRARFENAGQRHSRLDNLRATIGAVVDPLAQPLPELTQEANPDIAPISIGGLICAGDSITAAMNVSKGFDGSLRPNDGVKEWTDKKGKHHSRKFGVAISGQQTSAILDGVTKAEEDGYLDAAQALNVLGGVNDLASTRTPQQVQANLLKIYEKAASKNLRITACTLTPWDTEKAVVRFNKYWADKFGEGHPYPLSAEELTRRTLAINDWIRNKAATELKAKYPNSKFSVIDLHTEVTQHPGKYRQGGDGLHFTKTGSSALSEYIKKQGNIVPEGHATPETVATNP